MASEPAPHIDQVCATEGCDKQLRARGFCVACYYRNLRNGYYTSGEPTGKWKHRLSDFDKANRTANCAECGRVRVYSRGKNQWRCSVEARKRSRDYKRAYRASKRNVLLDRCEICASSESLVWDHDHLTGEFRGTLCSLCNAAIGMMNDDINRLASAIKYLSSGETEVRTPEGHNA